VRWCCNTPPSDEEIATEQLGIYIM
jgi:hypothetical protein